MLDRLQGAGTRHAAFRPSLGSALAREGNMQKLVLLAMAACAALALLRRRRRQDTIKGRAIDFSQRIKSKL